MSDVDIEQAKSLHRVAIQAANFCIDRNARLTAQERELIDYTVPALIASLTATQEKLAAAEAKFVALAFAIETGRRGTFSGDKTEELVDKVLAAFNTQDKP